MSLIVARKEAGVIKLVSDTKLSIQNEKKVSSERQKSSPSAGVIKITIINPNVCVAFAGGEDFADEAIKQIKPTDKIDDVLGLLLRVHIASNDVTDFIIAFVGVAPKLFEIKKQLCREVESTWIGSQPAYSLFQEVFHKESKASSISNFSVEPVAEETKTSVFGKMSTAMDAVISDEKCPEVGGFRVDVTFANNKFQYSGYAHTYFSNMPLTVKVPQGVTSIAIPLLPGTAENGGYSINFFYSENTDFVGLHILQGDFGIIYGRKDGGLLRPTIVPNMDEVDFMDYAEDNFSVKPIVTTQNRGQKCIVAGDELVEKRDFEGAIFWYDKALRHCYGRERAIFYYRKAVTLANLQRFHEVPAMLQNAINSDEKFHKPALELINNINRWYAKRR